MLNIFVVELTEWFALSNGTAYIDCEEIHFRNFIGATLKWKTYM